MRSLAAALVLAASAAHAQAGWVEDCGLQPPGSVTLVPVPVKDWEPQLSPAAPPLARREGPSHRVGGTPAASVRGVGTLANKVVYLSPGHGFTWEPTNANWRTQRGTTNAIVEDLVSVETLSQYLMPMLLNAGARVVPVRELDLNPNLVLVDDGEAGYAESGGGFSTSSLMGWGRPAFPMTGATTPFSLGANRLLTAATTATASATWTADIPADGYYDVAVSYTAFSSRVTDAHYVVRHAGGEAHFRVNQQRHGGTWVQLGRFYFRKGGTAQVVAQNDSASPPGSNLSLDAVKFGGGVGFTDRGAGVSGRPRFEESARYHAQWAGAPSSVWAPSSNTPTDDRNNDISTRSRFAAWVHEPGEDAVYVAWHTNAGGGRGTETYVYGTNPPDGTLQFSGVDGGVALATAIQGELINDFRQDAGLNAPTWADRRVRSAYFGEINPSNNPEMPAALVELAFHDSAADAAFLKEPTFRYHAARAIAQGIIRFFAQKDGRPVVFPPEPPTRVSAVAQGNGMALLTWRAPATDAQGVRGAAATGYRVYASGDGLSWDEGLDVTGTSASVSLGGAARYFRVSATNAGGESFPSATVGAREAAAGRPRALVVNAFDRLEAAIGKTEAFPTRYALGNVLRIFIERMNDGGGARLTGQALGANDVGFDIAEVDAAVAGDVPLGPYQLLAWFNGRGQQGEVALDGAEQGVISGFRGRNAPVFFTGAAANDGPFLLSTFSATLGAPGSALTVAGVGPLGGVPALSLDDGSAGAFDTGAPRALQPAGAAVQLATYGAGEVAAVGVPAQTALFAFPFETIVGPPARAQVMQRVLRFLLPATSFEDAGVVTPPEDAGVDGGAPVGPDAGSEALDAGSGPEDAGTGGEDGGALTRQQRLAFQGGGCSAAPALAPLLAVLALRRRRGRRGA